MLVVINNAIWFLTFSICPPPFFFRLVTNETDALCLVEMTLTILLSFHARTITFVLSLVMTSPDFIVCGAQISIGFFL